MVPIPNSNVSFGQATQMSKSDTDRLNRLYKCCKYKSNSFLDCNMKMDCCWTWHVCIHPLLHELYHLCYTSLKHTKCALKLPSIISSERQLVSTTAERQCWLWLFWKQYSLTIKINNISIHITDFMQTEISLLCLPDDMHSLCRNQIWPVSQLQGGQKNEEVGRLSSSKKPLKHWTLIVFWLTNKIL